MNICSENITKRMGKKSVIPLTEVEVRNENN